MDIFVLIYVMGGLIGGWIALAQHLHPHLRPKIVRDVPPAPSREKAEKQHVAPSGAVDTPEKNDRWIDPALIDELARVVMSADPDRAVWSVVHMPNTVLREHVSLWRQVALRIIELQNEQRTPEQIGEN